MKSLRSLRSATNAGSRTNRRGAIVVLAAFLLVAIMAFTAFTVDLGFITVTRAELQKSADGAALGGLIELQDGLGAGAILTSTQAEAAARQAAVDVAAANRGGGLDSVYCKGDRDVRVGQVTYDSATGTFTKTWGMAPYHMIEVTLRRDQGGTGGDRNLSLFFAPVIGQHEAGTYSKATAAMLVGVGVKVNSTSTVSVMPIAFDELSWNDLMAGIGPDGYAYDPDTGAISPGSDGVLEANIYPEGDTSLPPGNRGTVDFGDPNNSTSDLRRQIENGLNADDLSYFPGGELRTDNGPFDVNGDTGVSAGIKLSLDKVKGRTFAMPLFSMVSGPGNNATFTITKFVGVRLLDHKLEGAGRHVTVQPALFSDPAVIPGDNIAVQHDSIFTHPMLIP